MRVLNLGVHAATAVILIINGMLLLLAGLLVSGLAALSNGEFVGLFMTMGAALLIGVGVATMRVAFSNAELIESDTSKYLEQELKLALWAVSLGTTELFVLLAFNSFNVADVFAYGFGIFFVILGGMVAANLISYVLTMVMVRQ